MQLSPEQMSIWYGPPLEIYESVIHHFVSMSLLSWHTRKIKNDHDTLEKIGILSHSGITFHPRDLDTYKRNKCLKAKSKNNPIIMWPEIIKGTQSTWRFKQSVKNRKEVLYIFEVWTYYEGAWQPTDTSRNRFPSDLPNHLNPPASFAVGERRNLHIGGRKRPTFTRYHPITML